MELSLSVEELSRYVCAQLNNFFPDGRMVQSRDFNRAMMPTLERLEFCFSHIRTRGYQKEGNPFFYHLHSDQYCQFLYYLSNTLWKLDGRKDICDKLILLNRALHGCWFSYKCDLPDIFILGHPVGTVLGNATYSDYLVVLQNVTVNSIDDGKRHVTDDNGRMQPVLGKGLFLGAGAKIIGDQEIGDCVSIGIDACVYKQRIPSNSIVYRDIDGIIKIKSSIKCTAFDSFYM